MKRKNRHPSKRRMVSLPLAVQRTYEIIKPRRARPKESRTFTAMETGQPDREVVPDINNPRAVQGGMGPLNQEGEGERQNAQLAALEQIEPDFSREQK